MSDACVLLAAGAGRRLGGRNKALLRVEQQTFLARITTTCRAAAVEHIAVVVAEPFVTETRSAAMALGLDVVVNPHPELGMGASVEVGFAYALAEFAVERAWLWPVDTPFVQVETLRDIANFNTPADVQIRIPSYNNRGGHPTLVCRSVWPELSQCAQEVQGARSVFRRQPTRVARVPVVDSGIYSDVDQPQDLVKRGIQ